MEHVVQLAVAEERRAEAVVLLALPARGAPLDAGNVPAEHAREARGAGKVEVAEVHPLVVAGTVVVGPRHGVV